MIELGLDELKLLVADVGGKVVGRPSRHGGCSGGERLWEMTNNILIKRFLDKDDVEKNIKEDGKLKKMQRIDKI